MYQGQPFASTTTEIFRAKVSDGKSVNLVWAANSGALVGGNFYLVSGFFGCAFQSREASTTIDQNFVLNIEEAEFEVNPAQVTAEDTFAVGTPVFWNATTKKFVEAAVGNRYVGVVTVAKDAGGCFWFKLVSQANPFNALKPAANQAVSVAATVGEAVTDLNALLVKLKAAGLMAADA